MKFPQTGLYAITQTDKKSHQQIVNDVSLAIKGGAVVIQYRDKNPVDATSLGMALLDVCHVYHVPLLINDDVEFALKIGADGVHLGKDDGVINDAREKLGNDAIIGVSCYNDINRALTAEAEGADYVAFGRFFPSTSKPLAAPAKLETLQQAKNKINIPIVAIGGILPKNGGQLLEAGADLLAVIGGLFKDDVEKSAQNYQSLFH